LGKFEIKALDADAFSARPGDQQTTDETSRYDRPPSLSHLDGCPITPARTKEGEKLPPTHASLGVKIRPYGHGDQCRENGTEGEHKNDVLPGGSVQDAKTPPPVNWAATPRDRLLHCPLVEHPHQGANVDTALRGGLQTCGFNYSRHSSKDLISRR
jgi:hypothetical protein